MMNDAEIDELGGDKAGGLWLPARAPERAADCLANIRHALDEGATAEDYVRRYDNERPYDLAVKASIDVSHYALSAGASPRLVAERLRSLAEDARAARTTDDYSRTSLELYALGIEWIADLLERCE